MPPAQQPPQPVKTTELFCEPGIQRDGTPYASKKWTDGQWVRFQRGKPKKIGGYKAMTAVAAGPIRNVLIDARQGNYNAHLFSPSGIEKLTFDPNLGVGAGFVVRTPTGFTTNANYLWSSDKLISGGTNTPTLACVATPDANDITSDAAGTVYSGDITASTALTTVYTDVPGTVPLQVSGGIVALPPFLFAYGSNGLIQNSNPNNISGPSGGWTVSSGANVYANIAYVAGTKFVKGLPLRGGSLSPAGLFWALDALVRVSFQGSSGGGYFNYWRYDTISGRMSVLSKNSIIEYDGVYFWVGVDRFFTYNGVVQELPNDTNLNYFFDNLNQNYRSKVFAVKVPRYGEIWWFYPTGTNTECNAAVIYNVRENCWYDAMISRTAGQEPDIFPNPVMTGGENSISTAAVTYTVGVGVFNVGDTVTGNTSGAVGTVVKSIGTQLNIQMTSGTYSSGETIHNVGSTATGTVTGLTTQELDAVWMHEYSTDKIYLQTQQPIHAWITSKYMTYMTGDVQPQPEGANLQTRIIRVEPDFTSKGALGRVTQPMSIYINGVAYPNSAPLLSSPYAFDSTVPFVDLREQRRELTITFDSNTQGGFFEMGRVILTLEPGDGRG